MMRSPRGNAGDRSWKCAREEELSCLEVPVYVYDRSLVGSLLEDLSTLYVHNGNFRVLCFLLRRSRPTDCEVLFHQGMVLIFFFLFMSSFPHKTVFSGCNYIRQTRLNKSPSINKKKSFEE